MKFKSCILVFALLAVARAGRPDDGATGLMSGKIYALDDHRPLFEWKMTLLYPGPTPEKTWYYDAAGREVAHDRLLWKDGRLVGYEYLRVNLDEEASVRVEGGKVHYYLRQGDKVSRREETAAANFTAGSSPIVYIWQHWDELMAGKEVLIRYGVPDLTRSFEFILERIDSRPEDPPGAVVITMYPSSDFISLFVDPIYISYRADDRGFLRFSGRLLPAGMEDGQMVPLDGCMSTTTCE